MRLSASVTTFKTVAFPSTPEALSVRCGSASCGGAAAMRCLGEGVEPKGVSTAGHAPRTDGTVSGRRGCISQRGQAHSRAGGVQGAKQGAVHARTHDASDAPQRGESMGRAHSRRVVERGSAAFSLD